ncbi:uncharacterized protein yc1106_06220 [Curvularia clavata]|uniref:SH3 domain-containing protein n=1 Tax=Curvularia clavata TaxID=95742 RepID=A0A9Q8ZB26_CURCL|nr:uncharacterized protein yc1106_06220 [Curvularia clavata]
MSVHHNLTKDVEHPPPPVPTLGSNAGHETPSREPVELVADPKTDFRWAFSKKSGRPHQNDAWELELTEGEAIKVTQDMGRDWYTAINASGAIGWVHGSWIKFAKSKAHQGTKLGYTQFVEDLKQLLVLGELQEFPTMRSYVDECTRPDCSARKQDASSLGICVHDLQSLLNGSGKFSYEWLKGGRNLWHPDRFARFCHPEAVERLKSLSEQMFVMYGILMENCRR